MNGWFVIAVGGLAGVLVMVFGYVWARYRV